MTSKRTTRAALPVRPAAAIAAQPQVALPTNETPTSADVQPNQPLSVVPPADSQHGWALWPWPALAITAVALAGYAFGVRGAVVVAGQTIATLLFALGTKFATTRWSIKAATAAIAVSTFVILLLLGLVRTETAPSVVSPVDLRGQHLTSPPAALRGALLAGTRLDGIDLAGRSLAGAQAAGASFRGANLKGANLRGADVSGVDFTGACLRDADLSGAIMVGATWDGADLTGAVLPAGPSFSPRPPSMTPTPLIPGQFGASVPTAPDGCR
jgi:hypothetical protein